MVVVAEEGEWVAVAAVAVVKRISDDFCGNRPATTLRILQTRRQRTYEVEIFQRHTIRCYTTVNLVEFFSVQYATAFGRRAWSCSSSERLGQGPDNVRWRMTTKRRKTNDEASASQ